MSVTSKEKKFIMSNLLIYRSKNTIQLLGPILFIDSSH